MQYQIEEILDLRTKNESAQNFIDLLRNQKEVMERNMKELHDEKQSLITR